MPELPEVETVRRGLNKFLPGLSVKTVTFDWPKGFPNAQTDIDNFLVGAKVVGIKRRAKVLLIELSTDYTLVTHLKMTGQLVFVGKNHQRLEVREKKFVEKSPTSNLQSPTSTDEVRFGAGHPNESLIAKLPDKSTRVTLQFTDGSKLFFNDQRKFGWMRLVPTHEVPNIDFMLKVGPEPLADEFTAKDFIEQVHRRKNTTIKAAILDQTVVAGIGNIYADESLWGAKIHPATKVVNVPDAKLKTLYTEMRFVMNLAIEKGGSTDRNYVNAEGKKGSYLTFARVFRREGQACPRHPDTTILKLKVAGRGTHICPKCQKLS